VHYSVHVGAACSTCLAGKSVHCLVRYQNWQSASDERSWTRCWHAPTFMQEWN